MMSTMRTAGDEGLWRDIQPERVEVCGGHFIDGSLRVAYTVAGYGGLYSCGSALWLHYFVFRLVPLEKSTAIPGHPWRGD